jgi:hypothetical protein
MKTAKISAAVLSTLTSILPGSGMVMAVCLAGVSQVATAANIRLSSVEFVKDPAKVTAFQNAVTSMRAGNTASQTSTAYLTSWEYWSNTHGYLGAGPHASGQIATYVPYQTNLRCGGDATCIGSYAHLTDSTIPADRFTAQIWGTCAHGTLNFLPWHRLYLYYFERTVRKQSGTTDFNLPYWDYFNEKFTWGGIALPKLVRGVSAGVLYDKYRTPGLNENTAALDVNDGSATQAFKFTDFISFSNQLQTQPHGTMHCSTGSGCRQPDIGLVPVSGLDPVFYMHHANIDRLWQCWLNTKANGQTINLAWAKANLGMPDSWYQTTFSFVDENGVAVTNTIADVFTPGVIDTHYDVETNCVVAQPVAKKAALQAAVAATPMTLVPVANTSGSVLKGKTQAIALQASTNTQLLARGPTAAGVKPGHALLTIENIDIQGDPEVTYNIYLANKNDPSKAVYLATLNYFGLLEQEVVGHQHHATTGPKIGTLSYDVQDELIQLGVRSTADVEVRFVPTSLMVRTVVKERVTSGSVTVGAIHMEMAVRSGAQ